jgi:hypothetical protein
MYNRSLNETERILATHKDVVVPVKEIWLEVSKQGQLQRFEVPPLVDFTTLLEGDDRFEFLPAGDELGDNYVEPIDEDELDYTADIERLGFYSEDRVRLRNIEVVEESEEEEESEEPAVETEINEESPGSSTTEQMKAKARMSGNGGKTEKEEQLQPNKSKTQKTSIGLLTKNKKKAKSKK